MAKGKVEILASEWQAYVNAADISGVTIIDDPKKDIKPVQLGNVIVAVVSFRDPFYLMKWVRNVYEFGKEKSKPVEKQRKK